MTYNDILKGVQGESAEKFSWSWNESDIFQTIYLNLFSSLSDQVI